MNANDLVKFKEWTKLGAGACGVVYRARTKLPDTPTVIVKFFHEDTRTPFGMPDELIWELNAMRAIGPHPNIVPLFGAGLLRYQPDENEGPRFGLVLRDTGCTTLGDYVQSKQFDPRRALSIFRQIVAAAAHVAARGWAHRDIKPPNILYNAETDGVWLADFGHACVVPHFIPHAPAPYPRFVSPSSAKEEKCVRRQPTPIVTFGYRPPEIMCGARGYDTSKVDMWSVGCLLPELLSGKRLFLSEDREEWTHTYFWELVYKTLGLPPTDPLPAGWQAWPGETHTREFLHFIQKQPAGPNFDVICKLLGGCARDDAWVALFLMCVHYDPAARASFPSLQFHLAEIPTTSTSATTTPTKRTSPEKNHGDDEPPPPAAKIARPPSPP